VARACRGGRRSRSPEAYWCAVQRRAGRDGSAPRVRQRAAALAMESRRCWWRSWPLLVSRGALSPMRARCGRCPSDPRAVGRVAASRSRSGDRGVATSCCVAVLARRCSSVRASPSRTRQRAPSAFRLPRGRRVLASIMEGERLFNDGNGKSARLVIMTLSPAVATGNFELAPRRGRSSAPSSGASRAASPSRDRRARSGVLPITSPASSPPPCSCSRRRSSPSAFMPPRHRSGHRGPSWSGVKPGGRSSLQLLLACKLLGGGRVRGQRAALPSRRACRSTRAAGRRGRPILLALARCTRPRFSGYCCFFVLSRVPARCRPHALA